MLRRHFAALAAAPLAAALPAAAQSPQLWFIFVETGKPLPPEEAKVIAMQRGHLDNFKRLFDEGKLLAAGPLRDPSGVKRGIVIVKATDRAELAGFFEPDEYVREGYMTLNAQPARARRPLNSVGIDPSGIEEIRIGLLARPAGDADKRSSRLLRLGDQGAVGAWYSLVEGPVAEVVFARIENQSAVEKVLADDGGLTVWPQWTGKRVLR